MAEWTVVHLEHDGTELAVLRPENLQFTLEKGENGPHTISYDISRSAGNVYPGFSSPYVTDFELYRDADLILAGMHTLLTVNSDEEHVKIGGKGWLHYLERRYWPFDATDPNAYVFGAAPEGYAYVVFDKDPMEIITDILDNVLALTNSLGITYSLVNIGETVDVYSIDLIDTENVLSKIQSLSQRDPGEFDFWITNGKDLQRLAPRKYDVAAVVDDENADDIEHIFDADYIDSGLHAVRFTSTGPDATRVTGQGTTPTTGRVSTREYIPGSEQFRLLESVKNFGDIMTQQEVNKLTRKALLFGLNPVHEITIDVVSDRVANFWTRFSPGKAIWVKADLEGWAINSAQEIVSMDCTVDTESNELVSFKLNQIYGAEAIS